MENFKFFKIEDKFEILFYVSAILSIIGVLILAYVSPLINPPLISIKEISYADIEKKVHVEGTIKDIKKFKDKSTALLFYNTTTKIYIPKSISVQMNFEKGERIRALGVVKIYKGGLEIIVNDAKNIKIVEEIS